MLIENYSKEALEALKEKWRKEDERINKSDDYWCISGGDVKQESAVDARLEDERMKFKQRIKYLDYPETDSALSLDNITYAIFADCTTIKAPQMAVSANSSGIRGKCTGFSSASRLRMKKKLAKLSLKDKYPFFITLTYPELYMPDMRVSKRDLDVFRKAFARAFSAFIGGFWRLEYQKRGAQHYHMLLIADSPVSRKKIIEFIEKRWADIVRTSYLKCGGNSTEYQVHYERHRKSGHNVQFMKTREMVTNYISKYISKVDDLVLPDDTGRCWGQWQFNGKQLDFTARETGSLERQETVYLKRLVRKHKEASNRLTMQEQSVVANGEKSGIRDKELTRKLRQHKRDKKYAKRIAKQNTITLFGYGTESKNGAVIEKMLAVARLQYAESLFKEESSALRRVSVDLINLHISPSVSVVSESVGDATGLCSCSLVVGTRVSTKDGPGVVCGVVDDCKKVDVRLAGRLFNGGRVLKMYDCCDCLPSFHDATSS